jgi:hypothetical protein
LHHYDNHQGRCCNTMTYVSTKWRH